MRFTRWSKCVARFLHCFDTPLLFVGQCHATVGPAPAHQGEGQGQGPARARLLQKQAWITSLRPSRAKAICVRYNQSGLQPLAIRQCLLRGQARRFSLRWQAPRARASGHAALGVPALLSGSEALGSDSPGASGTGPGLARPGNWEPPPPPCFHLSISRAVYPAANVYLTCVLEQVGRSPLRPDSFSRFAG